MPELPEVETVRRVLEERLRGRALTAYEAGRPTFYRPPPDRILKSLVGRRVAAVLRRGKYLRFVFSGGGELILHLGMSGRLLLGGGKEPHKRFTFALEGEVLSFHDSRRFGRVGCALPAFGPEPLEGGFSADYLFRTLRKRVVPVKALLLDQRIVAGLGNIYATEALYQAGIRPGRSAKSLSRADCEKLCAAVRSVLQKAVTLGGTTLEDRAYLDPLGRAGRFQESVAVYGRDRCPSGHEIKLTQRVIAGRRALYCPVCQK